MAKRGAETSLTKNNWQDENEGDEAVQEQPAEASADKLAGRTFVKVRRKPETSEAATEFKLGGSSEANSGFNFDFNKGTGATETKTSNEANGPQDSSVSSTLTTSAPTGNAFWALINPNNWECPACEVSNKKDLLKCAACETPKPGTTPAPTAAPAASGFTFGVTTPVTSTFTFGVTSATDTTTTTAPATTSTFTFGTAVTSPTTSAFTFDSTASTTPFTFGTGSIGTGGFFSGSTTTTWNFASTTFGSNAGTVSFGDISGTTFGSGTPTTFEPTDQLATGGDQTKEEFKNKTAEPSGTEKDVTIYKIPTTVYLLSKVESKAEDGGEKKDAMKFVENGEGELKVNTVQDGDKKLARVVLRVEKTQRLVLNAPLFSGMTLGLQGEKYVKFCSNDLEGKPAVYLLKFKNKTESTQVKEHMEKAIAFVGP